MKTKRKYVVKSYLTEAELDAIIASSTRAGLSLSTFVQRVCLGLSVPSREDAQARRELLKVNADLGRLGGLLKQAITAIGTTEARRDIRPLLKDIAALQQELRRKVQDI